MDVPKARHFISQIRLQSEKWQNAMLVSPKVSSLMSKHGGSMDKMDLQALGILKTAIEETVNMKVTGKAKELLQGESQSMVGTSDLIVPMVSSSINTFQVGKQLDGFAIRGAILAGCDGIPRNMYLVDEPRLRHAVVATIPDSVDTIIFPVAATQSQLWVLMVVKILPAVGIPGSFPTADLILYDSAGGQYEAGENIDKPVIEYMKKAKSPKSFSCVPRTVTCARQDISMDSGIAVISNALALIHGQPFATYMSEVSCWEKRETYARFCVESAKANARVLARAEQIRNGMEKALEDAYSKAVHFKEEAQIHEETWNGQDSPDILLWRADMETDRTAKKNIKSNAGSSTAPKDRPMEI